MFDFPKSCSCDRIQRYSNDNEEIIHGTLTAILRNLETSGFVRRADRVVNLCEMKFCSEKFAIDAAYAEKLREKIGAFKRETGTRDNCHLTFVTTYGLRRNPHSSMVQSEVTLDDLFAF